MRFFLREDRSCSCFVAYGTTVHGTVSQTVKVHTTIRQYRTCIYQAFSAATHAAGPTRGGSPSRQTQLRGSAGGRSAHTPPMHLAGDDTAMAPLLQARRRAGKQARRRAGRRAGRQAGRSGREIGRSAGRSGCRCHRDPYFECCCCCCCCRRRRRCQPRWRGRERLSVSWPVAAAQRAAGPSHPRRSDRSQREAPRHNGWHSV